mmetsp:Transcript_5223/g.8835  ORF Transcript_5223/g.8835 Transcript_5223/m.8835 type:complete len:128 (+) Transcript_5223:1472-1855(+)
MSLKALKGERAGELVDSAYQEEQERVAAKGRKREQKKKEVEERTQEELAQTGKSIQRYVHKTIIKNRGITRRRKKIDSNSRVKKRVKYEQMEKKRRTLVQEYKGGHAQVYKGEKPGINTGVIRNVKF